MALALTTNNAALNAAASVSSVNRDIEKSIARLSSGKRINSASDYAAGVAMSSRLTAEVRGTNQAIRNALDAQALIDTAEGAHVEVENLLQRARELLIQGVSDTNSANDRANLSKEISAVFDEIERIKGATSWAGQNLFDGADGTEDGYKYNDYSFHVGSATGPSNQISVRIHEIGNDTEIAGLRILSTDIKTNFTTLLTAADDALSASASSRSELGAVSNRLNHTVNNLTNMSTNLSAARGAMEDADFALETTELAKNQILQQASTAMLAQANASKQNVLGLLRD